MSFTAAAATAIIEIALFMMLLSQSVHCKNLSRLPDKNQRRC